MGALDFFIAQLVGLAVPFLLRIGHHPFYSRIGKILHWSCGRSSNLAHLGHFELDVTSLTQLYALLSDFTVQRARFHWSLLVDGWSCLICHQRVGHSKWGDACESSGLYDQNARTFLLHLLLSATRRRRLGRTGMTDSSYSVYYFS